jgi:hypothetical protein
MQASETDHDLCWMTPKTARGHDDLHDHDATGVAFDGLNKATQCRYLACSSTRVTSHRIPFCHSEALKQCMDERCGCFRRSAVKAGMLNVRRSCLYHSRLDSEVPLDGRKSKASQDHQ